jgi:hypothetical protein
MPHLGTLAALRARTIAGPVPLNVVGQADAIGWKSVANMLRRSAIGEVESGFSTASGTGAELTGFVSSLAGQFFSAAVAAKAQQWPLHSRVGVSPEAGFAGAEVGEFQPVAPVLLKNGLVLIEPFKVTALIAVSLEALATRGFADIINRELELAIGRGLDAAFYSRLAPGSAGGFSAGSSALSDLRELASMLVSVTGQQMLFAASVDTCQRFATVAPGGLELFPMAGLIGVQEIKGVSCYPSDALAAGTLLAVDPTGLAAVIDSVDVEAGKNTAVQLDSVPGVPAQLVSMFQTSGVALRATCTFSCVPVRSQDVSAECTGIAWTEA